ncbi:UDP-glucosyltransferase 2-like [Anticarsia gemmatalis]|uniref:UDP-glucosyltransferase 2-like n=1 Tax=Anticarsia gemmatalis TaxID=129554 RepID=UPI003F777E1A
MALFLVLSILIITTHFCEGYKALVVTQMPSKSHSILNDAIVKQLLKEGNEVTYVRSIEYKNPPSTLRQIDVSSNAEAIPANALNIRSIMDRSVRVNDHYTVKHRMTGVSIKTMENKDVQKLLSDPKEHFDVVIVEFLDNDLLASFAAVFDCPMIWLSPIEVNSDILSRIDEIPNPAYVPDIMSLNIAPFTFPQRVQELWSRLKSQYLYYRYIDDIQSEAYNRLVAPHIIARGRKPPTIQEIRYNVSLVLGYSHVSMGEAARLPQSYKPVGGYHIDEDIKPLPENLMEIMDDAKDGVIYFSMGSNLKSKEWPEETKQSILQMLGGLKQTVFWKFEKMLPNVPKNVHISNWFPQLSILSHPNCALFITHGGLLSTAEALYFGVPIIGIPAFGDQFVNIKRAASKGFGVEVDMSFNVVEDLRTAIEEITSNPSYRQKAKEFSFIYHDRPVKPIVELSHWVRHVVQTRGAPHLRSPAIHVPFYQRFYLDLALSILVLLVISIKLLKLVIKLVWSKKKPVTKKKKN